MIAGFLSSLHADGDVTVYGDDCLAVLRAGATLGYDWTLGYEPDRLIPDASIDAVITDPPYGLAEHRRPTIEAALLAWLTGDREHVPDGRGFMDRDWDKFVPPPAVWDECLRVLKPGGYLLAFAGSRTVDLMGISIRLAGLTTDLSAQIRDSIAWLYGSGFPKSLDVARAIDTAAGAAGGWARHDHPGRPGARTNTGRILGQAGDHSSPENPDGLRHVYQPAEAGQPWQGWGTALKPAFEPIIVARRPLAGTVAANVQQHGTGALNIDGCRVGTSKDVPASPRGGQDRIYGAYGAQTGTESGHNPNIGRWPPNVALDEKQAAELDRQAGGRPAGHTPAARSGLGFGSTSQGTVGERIEWGAGGASRFFPVFRYEAKAPASERPVAEDGTGHPTVKPLDLIRWLIRLVTPPGGVVLDPFLGSGTTAEACLLEGARCIGMEREAAYLRLIDARLAKPMQPGLFQ